MPHIEDLTQDDIFFRPQITRRPENAESNIEIIDDVDNNTDNDVDNDVDNDQYTCMFCSFFANSIDDLYVSLCMSTQ